MYLYIHGFNSDVKCRSFFDLSAILSDVSPLGYDYTKKADFCFAQLCEQMEKHLEINTKKSDHAKDLPSCSIKILGSSLGGFWALHLAKKYNIPCLAFNPVTIAHEQLAPLIGQNQNFYTHEYWDFTKDTLLSYADFILDTNLSPSPHMILGQNDELLDYKIALNYWQNKAISHITDDAHSIMDYSLYKDIMLAL